MKHLSLLAGLVFVFHNTYAVLEVSTFDPAQNQLNVTLNSSVYLIFNKDIDTSTIKRSIKIKGSYTGNYSYIYNYYSTNKKLVLRPQQDFKVGEVITVTINKNLKSTDKDTLSKPFSWQFTAKVLDGTANFRSSIIPTFGSSSLTTADLNNDGGLDLVTQTFSDFQLLLNDNRGSLYNDDKSFTMGNSGEASFTSADFDNDGDMDIAGAMNGMDIGSSYAFVNLNNGNAFFLASKHYRVGSEPHSITSADFDNDGDMDLAVPNFFSRNISILLNNGDGTFAAGSTINFEHDYWSGKNFYLGAIVAADFNNDGFIDLAVTLEYDNKIAVLFNKGNGTFSSYVLYDVGAKPLSIVSADFNGDGKMDLAVANHDSRNIYVLLNSGNGNFNTPTIIKLAGSPRSIITADLDNDADLDMGVLCDVINIIVIIQNDGNGNFSENNQNLNVLYDYPQTLVSGDFDNDGDMDMIVSFFDSPGRVLVFYNSNNYTSFKISQNNISFGTLSKYQTKDMCLKITNKTDSVLNISFNHSNPAFSLNKNSLSILPHNSDSIMITFVGIHYGLSYDSLMLTSNISSFPYKKVTLRGKCLPSTPVNLSATSSDCQINLSWNKNPEPDIAKYNIYMGSYFDDMEKIDSTSGDITSKTFTEELSNLIRNRSHYFRITAVSNDGHESDLCEPIEVYFDCNKLTIYKTKYYNITIDGKSDEYLWEKLRWNKLKRGDNFPAQFKMCYDDDNLYLLVAVTDHTPKYVGSYFNISDCVTLYFAMDTSNSEKYREGDWLICRLTSNSTKFGHYYEVKNNNNWYTEANCSLLKDTSFKFAQQGDTTYVQEWQIPIKSLIQSANFNGRWFRFDMLVRNNYSNADSYSQIFWNYYYGYQWEKIENQAYIFMSDSLVDAIEAPRIKPVTDVCPKDTVTLKVWNSIKGSKYIWFKDSVQINEEPRTEIPVSILPVQYTVKDITNDLVSDPLSITWKKSIPDDSFPQLDVGGGPNVYYFYNIARNKNYSYQWYRDDQPIPGATKYYYVADQNYGTYYYLIRQEGKTCAAVSNFITINENSGNLSKDNSSLSVYPNPTNDKVYVHLNDPYKGEVSLSVIDMLGRVRYTRKFSKQESEVIIELTTEKLPMGYYLIQSKSSETKHVMFIKK